MCKTICVMVSALCGGKVGTNIQHDGLDLDNKFIHNFIPDDSRYCQIIVHCTASTLVVVKSGRNM